MDPSEMRHGVECKLIDCDENSSNFIGNDGENVFFSPKVIAPMEGKIEIQ
jgi:hypothetical protein